MLRHLLAMSGAGEKEATEDEVIVPLYICIVFGLVLMAGLMSGLTLGLMSLDMVELEVCILSIVYILNRCSRDKHAHALADRALRVGTVDRGADADSLTRLLALSELGQECSPIICCAGPQTEWYARGAALRSADYAGEMSGRGSCR